MKKDQSVLVLILLTPLRMKTPAIATALPIKLVVIARHDAAIFYCLTF